MCGFVRREKKVIFFFADTSLPPPVFLNFLNGTSNLSRSYFLNISNWYFNVIPIKLIEDIPAW